MTEQTPFEKPIEFSAQEIAELRVLLDRAGEAGKEFVYGLVSELRATRPGTSPLDGIIFNLDPIKMRGVLESLRAGDASILGSGTPAAEDGPSDQVGSEVSSVDTAPRVHDPENMSASDQAMFAALDTLKEVSGDDLSQFDSLFQEIVHLAKISEATPIDPTESAQDREIRESATKFKAQQFREIFPQVVDRWMKYEIDRYPTMADFFKASFEVGKEKITNAKKIEEDVRSMTRLLCAIEDEISWDLKFDNGKWERFADALTAIFRQKKIPLKVFAPIINTSFNLATMLSTHSTMGANFRVRSVVSFGIINEAGGRQRILLNTEVGTE